MSQKEKTKFRQSVKWKKFRIYMKSKYRVDYITHKPLRSGWNLHHMDLNEENYTDISDESHFMALNKMMHEIVHDLYRYFVNDEEILNRLKHILMEMKKINGD
ncbi:MAG: hypothetical protein KBT21_08590 [Treponema sp.]|nr:hypothetical protein [Candidatus Treponema merdequi]